MINRYVKIVLFFTGLFLLSCSSDNSIDEPVLAQIGEKYITGDEFLLRSVYTIRPAWCRNDNYVHKKIALNSLIAEKLLAIEAGYNTLVDNDPDIQAYLKGRKEQELRQLHFQRIAVDHVKLDDQKFNTALKNSERTYQTELIPIGDDKIARRLFEDLQKDEITFTDIKNEIIKAGGSVQELELKFDSPLDDAVYKALFQTENIDKGQVIGPIQLDENAHTLIRINGWIRRPLITDKDKQQRLIDVKEKEINVAAMDFYVDWIKELMRGKRIDFNKEVLTAVVEAVAPIYFKARETSKSKMQQNFWQLKDESQIDLNDISDRIDAIKYQTLFKIDDQIWTVEKFEQEIKVHPLVFRNPKMSKRKFGEQFRLAIADMIRNRYITADAYERGYDKNKKLKHRYSMWEDNLKAEYIKERILEEAGGENNNDLKIVEKIMDPYIQKLYKKYSEQIQINMDLFESIKFTDIDVFVIQENVPFPVYVPNFPHLTTYDRLDYGKIMQVE
jgi:hypothetical protein